MKRIHMCQRINRNNNTAFNHVNRKPLSVNTVSPEILVGQIWLQDEERPPVEIIELNSSCSNVESSPDEPPEHNLSQAWSYINKDRFQPLKDDYKVNKKARERRRLKNDNPQFADYEQNNSYDSNWTHHNIDIFKNNFQTMNNQTNSFTVNNKHLTNSETSSDNDNYDIEFIAPFGDCGDMITDNHMWDDDDNYDEQMITYNSDLDAEKQTIWIYSFKNKRLLTDNDFELVNRDPSSSTSCSKIEDSTYEEPTCVSRVASPIPATYVPRLDLSLGQTLSTVTEVTESNKRSSSNETERSINVILSQKPMNSWFASDIEGDGKLGNKTEKKTSVINWMALSPRERRRNYYKSNSDVILDGEVDPLEVNPKSETELDKSKRTSEIQGDVENKCVVTPITINRDDFVVKNINTEDIPPVTRILSDDIEIEARGDDGDYNTVKSKPKIQLNRKFVCKASEISSPIEKLDSNNWIIEETDEKQTVSYDYDLENMKEGVTDGERNNKIGVEQKLWRNNAMLLMKPAKWIEYLPITESSLSLDLSSNISIEKQSWFKRLINCFNCFK